MHQTCIVFGDDVDQQLVPFHCDYEPAFEWVESSRDSNVLTEVVVGNTPSDLFNQGLVKQNLTLDGKLRVWKKHVCLDDENFFCGRNANTESIYVILKPSADKDSPFSLVNFIKQAMTGVITLPYGDKQLQVICKVFLDIRNGIAMFEFYPTGWGGGSKEVWLLSIAFLNNALDEAVFPNSTVYATSFDFTQAEPPVSRKNKDLVSPGVSPTFTVIQERVLRPEDNCVSTIENGELVIPGYMINWDEVSTVSHDLFEKDHFKTTLKAHDVCEMNVISRDLQKVRSWGYYSQQSFYDWYVIGGRWSKRLQLNEAHGKRNFNGRLVGIEGFKQPTHYQITEGGKADSLPIKAIDFLALRTKAFKNATAVVYIYSQLLKSLGYSLDNPPTWKSFSEIKVDQDESRNLYASEIHTERQRIWSSQPVVKELSRLLRKWNEATGSHRYIENSDMMVDAGKKGKKSFYLRNILSEDFHSWQCEVIDSLKDGVDAYVQIMTNNPLCAHSYLYNGVFYDNDSWKNPETDFIERFYKLVASLDPETRLTIVDIHN